MENELHQWLDHAKSDIDTVLFLQKMHPKPIEIMCFHLQQSAEKYLKAYLFSRDIEPPKIHNLRVLCTLCIAQDETFVNIATQCAYLNPFGVNTRYPNDLDIDEPLLTYAISCAQTIQNFPPINALTENPKKPD